MKGNDVVIKLDNGDVVTLEEYVAICQTNMEIARMERQFDTVPVRWWGITPFTWAWLVAPPLYVILTQF